MLCESKSSLGHKKEEELVEYDLTNRIDNLRHEIDRLTEEEPHADADEWGDILTGIEEARAEIRRLEGLR